MGDAEENPPRTHYHFSISLRVSHPAIAPEEITKAIGLKPTRSWKAGEGRVTPAGMPLAGLNRETYWTTNVCGGRWPTNINDAIHEVLESLVPHRSFIHRIRTEGGVTQLFVGWFFENQSGDCLSYKCLALAGDLQVDLSFDVYSPEQPQRGSLTESPLP